MGLETFCLLHLLTAAVPRDSGMWAASAGESYVASATFRCQEELPRRRHKQRCRDRKRRKKQSITETL